MKHKFTAAVIAATSIVLLSCSWFKTKKQENSNPLIGQWKLDSMTVGKDTSGAFMVALLVSDEQTVLDFRKDTFLTITGDDRDTSFYKWNEKEMQVIPTDTSQGNFQYARLNDTTVTLTSRDSTVFFLQKR